jgi:hypothetical protein
VENDGDVEVAYEAVEDAEEVETGENLPPPILGPGILLAAFLVVRVSGTRGMRHPAFGSFPLVSCP